MRLRCIKSRLDERKAAAMGLEVSRGQDFHLTSEKEYLVIGLQFSTNTKIHGTGVWVHLVSDYGHLTWAPISLFEVVDPRVSRYWEIRMTTPGVVTLWPALLYTEFFHEDLADGQSVKVREFQRLQELLKAESG
jgi:hypothetical protein